MKIYQLLIVVIALYLWGCSSTINTINMTANERMNYTMNLYNDKDYENAAKEFQSILMQYPGSTIIDSAQYYLGMTRFNRGEYIMAAYEFSKLIKNMPSSKLISNAQFMLADSYNRLSPFPELDQKYTRKAIQEFQSFIDFFPTDPKVPEAEKKIADLNDKLAEKEYHTAYIYNKLEAYKAAQLYYDLVIETYHDTKYASMAMYDKIKLLISIDKNSKALAEITKFIERYPDNSNIKEIELLKSSLEEKISAAPGKVGAGK